jgi:hypothetical protein
MDGDAAVQRLESDGLAVKHERGPLRTTRRWQAAMARAAMHLYEAGDAGSDLRVPIARALIEIYGMCLGDDELADLVEAMLPIEARSLGLS